MTIFGAWKKLSVCCLDFWPRRVQFAASDKLSRVKKKIIIGIGTAILLFRVAGWFCWTGLPPVSSHQNVQSPDKRYAAKVINDWHGDLWGRPCEYHHVSVETADGQIVRQVFTDEPWTGWPKDCLIEWATNSSSVTFIFKAEEAMKTHLNLDTSP